MSMDEAIERAVRRLCADLRAGCSSPATIQNHASWLADIASAEAALAAARKTKLFKMDIRHGQDGLEVLALADSEAEARAHVASRYTGWEIENLVEIQVTGPKHFVLAELEPEEKGATLASRARPA